MFLVVVCAYVGGLDIKSSNIFTIHVFLKNKRLNKAMCNVT